MPASRSLIALLVATVAFFVLWTFALKGNSSSTGGGSSKGPLGQYQSDVNAAHKAVATSNASNAASGNENATPSSGGAAASSGSTPAAKPASSSASTNQSTATSTTGPKVNPAVAIAKAQKLAAAITLSVVREAVNQHKVVALLFYNPRAADDRAVARELWSVPSRKGQVVRLAVPVSEASAFTAVTQQVPLNFSPTLVLISKTDQASEIVGFSDSFEINQRVADALAAS